MHLEHALFHKWPHARSAHQLNNVTTRFDHAECGDLAKTLDPGSGILLLSRLNGGLSRETF